MATWYSLMTGKVKVTFSQRRLTLWALIQQDAAHQSQKAESSCCSALPLPVCPAEISGSCRNPGRPAAGAPALGWRCWAETPALQGQRQTSLFIFQLFICGENKQTKKKGSRFSLFYFSVAETDAQRTLLTQTWKPDPLVARWRLPRASAACNINPLSLGGCRQTVHVDFTP